MVANTNDGSGRQPRLVRGISLATLADLPPDSAGPRGDLASRLIAAREAGYEALQTPLPGEATSSHVIVAAIAKHAGDRTGLHDCIRRHRDVGCDSTTIHLGTCFQSDSEMLALGETVLKIADTERYPVYIETHRATMTQDMWRTLMLVEHLPELRFAGDFGQWYLGHEIPYGGVEEAIARLEPIFARTRLLHLRLTSGAAGQIATDDTDAEGHLPAFLRAWRSACAGFLGSASPGDYLGAYVELLPPRTGYPRMIRGADGAPVEQTDRWLEAVRLISLAEQCFAEAVTSAGP